MQDVDFLVRTFAGGDIVYLMEAGGRGIYLKVCLPENNPLLSTPTANYGTNMKASE
jgi:hypothetical protein